LGIDGTYLPRKSSVQRQTQAYRSPYRNTPETTVSDHNVTKPDTILVALARHMAIHRTGTALTQLDNSLTRCRRPVNWLVMKLWDQLYITPPLSQTPRSLPRQKQITKYQSGHEKRLQVCGRPVANP